MADDQLQQELLRRSATEGERMIPASLAGAALQLLVSTGPGQWIARTVDQVKALLGLSGTNSGDQDLSGLEPGLGNPAGPGRFLTSTEEGARSWAEVPAPAWGEIGGDLADQADLQGALDDLETAIAAKLGPTLVLPVHANNAAALAGGLTAGKLYRAGADPDPVCIVH